MHTFPVPGGPANTMARPAIFLEFIVCSTIPIACKHKEHDHKCVNFKTFSGPVSPRMPGTRGLLNSGPLDFVHPAIATPL